MSSARVSESRPWWDRCSTTAGSLESGVQTLRLRSELHMSSGAVWDWYLRPGALGRLTPPWSGIRVEVGSDGAGPEPYETGHATLRLRTRWFPGRWTVEQSVLEEGRVLRYVQRHGPFKRWVHTRRFEPVGSARTRIEDEVEWEAPLGGLAGIANGPIEDAMSRALRFQHARIARDLELHRRYARDPLRVAVTGSGGFLGRALTDFLDSGGHEVIRVIRYDRANMGTDVYWNPSSDTLHRRGLEGVDAVVHLAGEPISAVRWSKEKKEAIRESRVRGTRLLSDGLAALEAPPKVFVSGSAIGFYGDRGDEVLDETSGKGTGFLADVVEAWEAGTDAASSAGIRVLHARTGIVLSPAAGVLAVMLRPFRLGLGGRLGDGEQYMSWVDVDDWVAMVMHAIMDGDLSGPMNLTAPSPVTNAEFTDILGQVLRRPTLVPVPGAAVRALMGEAGEELALSGQRVMPAIAQSSGYRFLSGDLASALRFHLGRKADE